MSNITIESVFFVGVFFLIFALSECLLNIAQCFLEKSYEYRNRRKYYENLLKELKRR